MLSWLHIGDLHVSHEDDFAGVERLRHVVADANRFFAGAVDFVFLPGDNANNGTEEQYAKINEALFHLTLPVFAVPGDHDFEPGSLHAFSGMRGACELPMSRLMDGHRCLFVDIVSAGSGGPDFRLGVQQTLWLKRELSASIEDEHRPLVFMHAYPGDLQQAHEHIGQLFADARVALVDTGHTHYNELLNDGLVIYSATRSTAQVEEGGGVVGYSIVCVDDDVVSWRFKPLGSQWPLVIITSPSDYRLVTNTSSSNQMPQGTFEVRAKVFGEGIRNVTASIDERETVAMLPVVGEPALWAASMNVPGERIACSISVHAEGENGYVAKDRVIVLQAHAFPDLMARTDACPGTDAHVVAPWPEHGILGTQLGPNKYGKKW